MAISYPSPEGIVRVAMPDAGTNITVQLTGPFVATVRIATILERLVG